MSHVPFSVWAQAARPKTIPASLAPVLVGSALAAGDQRLHVISALLCALGAVLIQIGTNYCNDYFDFVKGADTDSRKGPTRVVQAGLVTPAAMLRAAVLVLVLAATVSVYLVVRGGWPMFAVAVTSLIFAVLYTGGPAPLAYLGLGDVFVLIFFGFAAVCGTYYVQALSLPPYVLVASLGPGLFSVALLTVNNLRDVDEDRVAAKRTLAVRFGLGFARAEYLLCVLAAAAIPILLVLQYGRGRWALMACSALLIALPAIRRVLNETDGPGLNPALGETARALIAYAILFSIGWLV